MPYRTLTLVLCVALLSAACTTTAIEKVTDEEVAAHSDAIELFLIGDAGLPAPGGEPVLQALRRQLTADTLHKLVVYLGDNAYPHGLPDSSAPDRKQAEQSLNAQIAVLRDTHTPGIFIPGNHDWDAGSPDGWDAIRREWHYIRDLKNDSVSFLPTDGCPGPAVLDLQHFARLIILDTQWWLQRGPKPIAPQSTCPTATDDEVTDSIRSALSTAEDRPVIVVAHHPLVSGGQHGGYFDWPTNLYRPYLTQAGFVFADQDVSSTRYRHMRLVLARAFQEDPPFLFAAGHEHNLQLLRGRQERFNVVSGGGIYGHTTPVRDIGGTLFAQRASGFVRLTLRQDHLVHIVVYTVDSNGKSDEAYAIWLDASPDSAQGATPAAKGE
ncbi:MAG TPA: metallophosphoesterase [Gemmatimonadaceae bacterium]|nr:metallophosphoesterase [Gemmatimonadaceae bacterium]